MTPSKFKLKKRTEITKTQVQYIFADNDPTDNETTLEFRIATKLPRSRFTIQAVSIKGSTIIIPGETHKLTLSQTGNQTSRLFYYEILPQTNAQQLKLIITHNKKLPVEYFVKLKQEYTPGVYQVTDVNLEKSSLPTHRSDLETVEVELPAKIGIYTVEFVLPSGGELNGTKRVEDRNASFSFLINNMVEIEANGMFEGVVDSRNSLTLSLTAPTAGLLILTFFPCSSSLNFFINEKGPIGDSNPKMIFSTKNGQFYPNGYNYTVNLTDESTIYLLVSNNEYKNSSFTLISKMHNFGLINADRSIKLYPLVSAHCEQQAKMIRISVGTPSIDLKYLKQVYPEAQFAIVDLTMFLYLGSNKTSPQKLSLINEHRNCPSDLKNKGVYQSQLQFEISAEATTALRNTTEFNFAFDDELAKEMMSKGLLDYLSENGEIVLKAVVYVYDHEGAAPSASIVKLGQPEVFPLMKIYMDDIQKNHSEEAVIETTSGKILLILITMLTMILILGIIYYFTHKGGKKEYRRVTQTSADNPTSFTASQTELSSLKQ